MIGIRYKGNPPMKEGVHQFVSLSGAALRVSREFDSFRAHQVFNQLVVLRCAWAPFRANPTTLLRACVYC